MGHGHATQGVRACVCVRVRVRVQGGEEDTLSTHRVYARCTWPQAALVEVYEEDKEYAGGAAFVGSRAELREALARITLQKVCSHR